MTNKKPTSEAMSQGDVNVTGGLLAEVQAALSEASSRETSFDAFNIADLLGADDDRLGRVAPVSSTFCDGTMVYIYRVDEPSKRSVFVASAHSDGGVCIGWAGPFETEAKAREAYKAHEGWTEF